MNEDVLLAVFVAVESAHAFSAYMPSAFTVRTFAKDEVDIKNLRSGYLPAVLFVALISSIVAVVRKNAMYLVIAALVSVMMISLYEYSIHGARDGQ